MAESHQATTVLVRAGRRSDGSWVHEEVRVAPTEHGRLLVLQSPGLVLGIAAGDVVELTDGGEFAVVERGGNIAVHIYCAGNRRAVADFVVQHLGPHGGKLDGIGRGLIVVTIPARAGFPLIEERLGQTVQAFPGTEWYYGNVYDPGDGVTILEWVSDVLEHKR